MDPREPDINESWFKVEDNWKPFYCEDELPPNMPKPLGNSVSINVFVDASHMNTVVTRRSHTGIVIKVNNASVIWLPKHQNTVKSSTFGSEFVAV